MNNLPDSLDDIVSELSTLEPGKLPLDIFAQVARLSVTPVVEIVPFYLDEQGVLKVMLLQRDSNDALWPGMYHVPGTIVLATDTSSSFSDALERIMRGKLQNYETSKPLFIGNQLCKVSRGTEVAIIYMVNLTSAPEKALLFDPQNLPRNLIEGQEDFIKAALLKS